MVGAIISMRGTLASVVAVASTAVMLRLSGSASIIGFLSSVVPRMYGSLLSWLTPPYLYFIINGIIISIAASSRFQKAVTEEVDSAETIAGAELAAPTEHGVEAVDVEESQETGVLQVVSGGDGVCKEDEEFVQRLQRVSQSDDIHVPMAMGHLLAEDKPQLVSSRFGNHRKNVKPSLDGKTLRNKTLESMSRTITDGRTVPLASHLNKSTTLDVFHDIVDREGSSHASSPVMKGEAFNQRLPTPSGGPSSAVRFRREPSLGQDDLNRRVEAFINKFNKEMRAVAA